MDEQGLAILLCGIFDIEQESNHVEVRKICLGSILLVTFLCTCLHASKNCDLPQLQHQQKDAATIKQLENAWSVAFLHGDTQFMSCLLVPEYTEIMRSGVLKHRSDELEMTARNQGKNLAVPELPQPAVLLHDNVAVAYGESLTSGADGKAHARRFADSFVWENGRWHAFFSQQTPVKLRKPLTYFCLRLSIRRFLVRPTGEGQQNAVHAIDLPGRKRT